MAQPGAYPQPPVPPAAPAPAPAPAAAPVAPPAPVAQPAPPAPQPMAAPAPVAPVAPVAVQQPTLPVQPEVQQLPQGYETTQPVAPQMQAPPVTYYDPNTGQPMAPAQAVVPAQPAPYQVQPQPQQMMNPAVAPQPAVPGMPALDQLNNMMMGAPAPGGTGGLGDDLSGYDLSNVQESMFRTLPLVDATNAPISYVARIEKAALERSKDGLSNNLTVTMVIVSPSEYAGCKIVDYISMKDQALFRFKSLCRWTGLLSPDEARCIARNTTDFVGKLVSFNIRHDDYNGEKRNKVNGAYLEVRNYADTGAMPVAQQPQAQVYAAPPGQVMAPVPQPGQQVTGPMPAPGMPQPPQFG